MAGFKRGGSRGGASGSFKKKYTKKRASPDGDDDAPRASKKAKNDEDEGESAPVAPKLATDDDGNVFIGLNSSGKRRVTVSEFNKNTLISIREYWVNDSGELKPGKKGISLTVDQYNTLLAAAPLLESVLAKKDIQVARPDYEADLSKKEEGGGDGSADEGDDVGKVDEEEEEEEEDED